MSDCPSHGAAQEGLPCAWCHKGGRYWHVPKLPDGAHRFADSGDAFMVTYSTYSLERFAHKDGREWRVWMLVEST